MIYFVTPAYGRVALTTVCLEQRRWVIDQLADAGIEAKCVVVADDANLDTAIRLKFSTVVQNNEWLGRKFNDGIEFAANHGANWIVPIGSDSWIDPAYFLPLPGEGEVRTSSYYCAVTDSKLAQLRSRGDRKAIGPYMFPRELLESCGFRPAADYITRSVDQSTVRGIGQPINWVEKNIHPFQYVGFRGIPTITPYDRLVRELGVREFDDPWVLLAEHYPSVFVDWVRVVMKSQYEAVNG